MATVSAQMCTPGKARLVNGTRADQGVLEICTDGRTWSTVCYNYFSCNEHKVACRQAGYDEGIELLQKKTFLHCMIIL